MPAPGTAHTKNRNREMTAADLLLPSLEALASSASGLAGFAAHHLGLAGVILQANPADLIKGAIQPADAGGFSFVGLFLQASLVVKLVMIGLLLSSIWSWAIVVEKLIAFRRARVEADKFEQMFWSGQSLDELYNTLSRGRTITMAALFVAAMREWKRSVEGNIRAMGGIQLRVEKVMDVTISREMERLDRRLLFLATVGSTAPFVGLFGTVWGIMTSFQAIAASKNTSLAVVAPGIAEALFATALGLMAAIPAVVFYNKFSADSAQIGQRLEAFADEFAAIVSRQIDVRS
jgi:biopolymer transport protein TolQ